jgi:hypothetical protein
MRMGYGCQNELGARDAAAGGVGSELSGGMITNYSFY